MGVGAELSPRKFLGDGAWQARKHGVQGRCPWRKVVRAMDAATAENRAVAFTPSREGDGPVLPDLMGQVTEDEDIGAATADGADDARRCHSAIIARGGRAIIPIRKNGRPWKENSPDARARNETLRAARHYVRALWERWTGYKARSRAKARTRCLNSCGARIAAVRHGRSDQWRSNGAPPTDRPPKSTSARPS